MIKSFFIVVFCLFSALSSATNSELASNQADLIKIISQPDHNYAFGGTSDLILSNGPLVNSPGTGIGNADESILQDVSLGMSTLGTGHQQSSGGRVSDDFTLVADGFRIQTVEFFAYQTNEQASTITAMNLRIWDGPPGQAGSQVVFGDTSTDRMTNTEFSGILRVRELDSGASNIRQIAVSTVTVNVTLNAGTYWLDWQADGSGPSGPWAPPITIAGSTSTGNAMRSTDNGQTFEAILDAGTNTPLGLPFILRGTFPPALPVDTLSLSTWLLLIVLILGATKFCLMQPKTKD